MPAPTSTQPPIPAPARNIRLIVIHCSASPNERTLFTDKFGTPGFTDPVHEIDAWHQQRGFQRDTYWRGRQNSSLRAIGYHYVLARNAALFSGRHEEEVGAHAQGWNAVSLGICLVGTDQFTALQWAQLAATVSGLAKRLAIPLQPPTLQIIDGKRFVRTPGICGHNEIPGVAKTCPGFDVSDWLAGGMKAMPAHTANVGVK